MAPRPVVLSGRLVAYYGHICASVGHPMVYALFHRAAGTARQPQRVPNLLRQSLHPMPSPVLRWSRGVHTTMPSSPVLPSPSLHRLGNHFASRFGTREVCVTKLQRSLNATARWRCSPRSDRGFYDRAFLDRVAPNAQVGYDWMVHRHLPSPDFHRLDWQPYGLRPNAANTSHKPTCLRR